MVFFSPAQNEYRPMTLAQALPSSQEGKPLLVDNVLKNFERTLGLMEDKVKEMEASGDPNASRARDKFEEAKNIKNNLKRQKGGYLPKSNIQKYLDRIKQLNSEIDKLKETSLLFVAPRPYPELSADLETLKIKKGAKSGNVVQAKLQALDRLAKFGTGSKEEVLVLEELSKSDHDDLDVKRKAMLLLGSASMYYNRFMSPIPEELQNKTIHEWREVLNQMGTFSEERIIVISSFYRVWKSREASKVLKEDNNPECLLVAIDVFKEHGGRSVHDPLKKLVYENPNIWVKAAALSGLGGMVEGNTDEILSLYSQAIESGVYLYRLRAIQGLPNISSCSPQVLKLLQRAHEKETDPELKALIEKQIEYVRKYGKCHPIIDPFIASSVHQILHKFSPSYYDILSG